VEPQVIVPSGIPPDERVNLNSDEVDDLVITAYNEPAHGANDLGQFVRGIAPLPGTMLLMTREGSVLLHAFRLREAEVLTPERLASGLAGNELEWVNADDERAFVPLARHPYGLTLQTWTFDANAFDGALVYRTMEYDRPVIGTLEILSAGTGGHFGVRAQTWVEEGQVLDTR
jgi:hypothetical protein